MASFIYFFISYPRTKKDNPSDLFFIIPENSNAKPECIYTDENYENKIYYYKKIFKANKLAGKKIIIIMNSK